MEYLNQTSFKEKIFNYLEDSEWKFKGNKPTIVDFYADWCMPCKSLEPLLEEIQKEYKDKLDIYKINVETEPELAKIFSIISIPSLLFIPLNDKPQMGVGLMPKGKLKSTISDILKIND